MYGLRGNLCLKRHASKNQVNKLYLSLTVAHTALFRTPFVNIKHVTTVLRHKLKEYTA